MNQESPKKIKTFKIKLKRIEAPNIRALKKNFGLMKIKTNYSR
ncbi:hypothetical protein AZO1586I_465 [Bathymodiolus thermophilus thioautotrophic gill symbiont]|uniref:Transposase n=1 Tax=Bathymodiolus thermophilus thioautotrophic gill symbiont TaxID=2360 RepID=A0ABM8M6D1_9GAMM|nr:hypothetical protein AZO1586I_465 [Bathymodiolus thermophilus thioautotrophic gill symbiont]CAC9992682.1 hypothetical protein [uncultured Gammaproteobacteria bacterium]CAC9999776.1 hypothetical protein [uncultured Gammaproteobacteria bacterium]VVH54883.1 hypothetical protein BAZOLSSOX_1949 [uncultured Gammaproteobacteria bacterium]